MMRKVVRCLECGLNQFVANTCRRCRLALLVLPSIKAIELPTLFAGMAGLPTVEELERELITEAMRRCDGNPVVAAALIGMGKTTIYRKLKEAA